MGLSRGEYRCLTTLFSSTPVPISSYLSSLFILFLFSKEILTDKLCLPSISEFPSLRNVPHYIKS